MKLNKIRIITVLCLVAMVSIFVATANAQEPNPVKKPPIRERVEGQLEKSSEIRNTRLETKKEIGDLKEEIKDERKNERKDIRATTTLMMRNYRATTTTMFKKVEGEKRDISKQMKLRAFQIRKDALVKELNFALANLKLISQRIGDRITKTEASGRVMTEAKTALTIANDKIDKAKIAIDNLTAFSITPATNADASTTDISLDKPRQIGDEAIKAIKEAKEALKKVVTTMAHAMGVATTTPERRDGENN